MTYPHTAGFKGEADTGRVGAAHANQDLGRRQAEAFNGLSELGEATADQVAERIGRLWFHTRPRFSELKAQGLIQDTGRRALTGMGGKTIVWRLSTPEELALHRSRKAAEAEHGEKANG